MRIECRAQWFINVALEKAEKHKNRITPQYHKEIKISQENYTRQICREKHMMTCKQKRLNNFNSIRKVDKCRNMIIGIYFI